MKTFLFLALAEFALATCTDQFDSGCYSKENITTRDVAVIGGGASGTYGAVNLHDSHSIIVIEKEGRLGGQTRTYTVPGSGTKVDWGVQAFWNTTLVTNFFKRFNVAYTAYTPANVTTVHADFTNGKVAPNFVVNRNLTAYSNLIQNYEYLLAGWNLPHPVPEDILGTWGDFLKQKNITNLAYSIYSAAPTGGVVNMLGKLAVQVLRAFNENSLQNFAGAALVTAAHDNSLIYERAQALLGKDVLLNSTVIAARRPSDNSRVKLVVQSPSGKKLVLVSQLLISIPQIASNLQSFDLDKREYGLFSQFATDNYYCGLISNTGLPDDHSYENIGLSTPYNIPQFPALYHVYPTKVSGLHSWWYASEQPTSQANVQAAVCDAIAKLRNSSGIAAPQGPCQLTTFGNHSPYNLHVGGQSIRDGFYDGLNALQGYRKTWYTGLTWTPSTGTNWKFTSELLPNITRAIQS